MRLRDTEPERYGKPGPLPSPPERSDAGDMGGGSARRRSRARIRGGHQNGNSDDPQWALTGILSGFTGHEHDPDIGLINMKGRIYDPAIGRFISADPYVQYPFWGQGLNRYSYGFNNPMSGSDPTGFAWYDKVFGDSSGWEVTAAVAGFGTAVGAAAYAVHLGQGGSVSAGGLAGASGLGGAYAIGEAFMGLNDPGANATYAAPTGELGQGALYYEGAGAAAPGADMRLAQAGGQDVLGPFVVTGTYPGDGGGGTGPVLPPVPNLQLTPPNPSYGVALGLGGQLGASWIPPFVWGGSAGVYISNGSLGFYYGFSHSQGLGAVVSAGPQLSLFTSLDAFRGVGLGGEVMFGPGVAITTPATGPGTGYSLAADSPIGGVGGGVFAGGTLTDTQTVELWKW